MGEEPPHLVRAIKLNVPFYGLTGQGWFAAMAALANYLKISIFAGVDLQPPPPVATASHGEGARTRCLPITSPQDIDERQLLSWLRQTQEIKGWGCVPARDERQPRKCGRHAACGRGYEQGDSGGHGGGGDFFREEGARLFVRDIAVLNVIDAGEDDGGSDR